MRKVFSLSQYFLICAALLISSKSFAADCPSGGITSSITCAGNIITSLSEAHGIFIDNSAGSSNTNVVNMTGNILTTGNNARGIFMDNRNGSIITVNMTGDISTTGTDARGIYLLNLGGTNTVNMIGNITTTGGNARGIYLISVADTNTVNMAGNVTTSGIGSYGISLENWGGTANTNTVNMIGDVTTTGFNARGIDLLNYASSSNANTVNFTGNVSTSGNDSYGIYLNNDSGINNTNTVNMKGSITTSGANAFGFFLNNNIATNSTNNVNMTGNITTSGNDAVGISLANADIGSNNANTINMTGNITTNGSRAYGIYLLTFSGSNNANTFNMSGNITTSGIDAIGINMRNNGSGTINNNSNTVNMTGNITTSGIRAYGIYLDNYQATNSTNTVNMTGSISAADLSSRAIYAYNTSTNFNIVQLNKGSSVIGDILGLGSNNFLKLNLGAGASYSFATTGFTVTDLNGRPMVAGSAHAAGVGNITTASQSLYERTSQITQSLDDRLRTHDLNQNTVQPYWINTYYSDSSRGGQGLSGSNLSFNQYRSGITAGFNLENGYTPTELVVNYEYGKLNIDDGNQSIQSNSIMAGVLFPDIKKLFNGTLSAKALVGYSDFNGDRKVLTNDVAYDGSRNVTANYKSTHLTLGSAWTKTLYQTDKIILDTLVGVDLNAQHINSYSESDLFKWSGRTINQLQERVSLGMEIKPMVKPLTLFGRVGIEHRDLLSGENQNFTINNTAVSYNDCKQRNTYATLNAGAYYPLTPTIKAYAQVRYYDSDKNIDSLSGNFGISGQF
ncbi:Autotransporter beta-domain containing protein [Methylophilaceae bacterium]